MGGCCIGALVLLLGPRIFLIGVWLLTNWYDAFDSALLAILGWLFLPYTSLAWMYVYFHNAGQASGPYMLLMIIAVMFDVGVFGSGHRSLKR